MLIPVDSVGLDLNGPGHNPWGVRNQNQVGSADRTHVRVPARPFHRPPAELLKDLLPDH